LIPRLIRGRPDSRRANPGSTGRSLGGWVLDPDGGHQAQVLGSTWNGSFGLALDSRAGIVVAIASNIEFDRPAELMAELIELISRMSP
jgi:hypothetical protein